MFEVQFQQPGELFPARGKDRVRTVCHDSCSRRTTFASSERTWGLAAGNREVRPVFSGACRASGAGGQVHTPAAEPCAPRPVDRRVVRRASCTVQRIFWRNWIETRNGRFPRHRRSEQNVQRIRLLKDAQSSGYSASELVRRIRLEPTTCRGPASVWHRTGPGGLVRLRSLDPQDRKGNRSLQCSSSLTAHLRVIEVVSPNSPPWSP